MQILDLFLKRAISLSVAPSSMTFKEIYQEIKAQVDLLDLVSQYVNLKRVGKNYVGLCPFHSERTPSFTVNLQKGLFKCFGCGASGDVINFYMKIKGLDFKTAVIELAKKAGLTIDEATFEERKKELDLVELNFKIAKLYHNYLLRSEEGSKGLSYLQSRGLSLETIRHFMLGYAPSQGRVISSLLRTDPREMKLAEELGLIKKGEDGGYVDLFRNRIIFPIFNQEGECVGFGGRSIDPEVEPKYLNSPESSIFKKSEELYGLFQTKSALKEQNHGYLVEGYFDLLTLWQKGIKNVVATCGTALTDGHLKKLRRLAEHWIILYDGDEAGKKATLRAINLFISKDILPKVIVLPQGQDPDSYFQAFSEEKNDLAQVLENLKIDALTFIKDLYQRRIKENPKDTFWELLEILQPGQDPFLKKKINLFLAELFGLPLHEVERAIHSKKKKGFFSSEEEPLFSKIKKTEETINPYYIIAQYLVNYPDDIPQLVEHGVLDILDDDNIYSLFIKEFINFHLSGGNLTDITDEIFHQIYNDLYFSTPFEEREETLSQIITYIKKTKICRDIEKIKLSLIREQYSEDNNNMEYLLYQIKEILKLNFQNSKKEAGNAS